jgi:hypothetical protein
MRHEVLFAVPLVVGLMAAAPMRAQRVTSPRASPATGVLAPLTSDSVSSRMLALGLLLSPSLPTARAALGETTQGSLECPMPILRPDSAKRLSGLRGEPLHSSDRMPTRVSPCVNPLNKSGQVP